MFKMEVRTVFRGGWADLCFCGSFWPGLKSDWDFLLVNFLTLPEGLPNAMTT